MKQSLDADFICRKCGRTVLINQYVFSRFCPDCGTMLRPLRYWVFQFNPAIYNWHDWIKENRKEEQWLVSKHAKSIQKGDRVVIWASGEKAGIYAIGEVVEDPHIKPLSKDQEKYWTGKDNIIKFEDKPSVMIKYLKLAINNPLLEEACKKDPVLKAMEILRHPQGTNFPLTREQWKRILKLLSKNS
ncbi:MAG: EVE domain-containing protein [Candidatus Bathyarchaeia archaeon]